MFYEFSQNNSGGSFVVNDSVCHRLIIEADNEEDAISKAEDLGCYWDGVSKGIDCPCCGDRWYPYASGINLMKIAADGYRVEVCDGIYEDTVAEWNKRYGKYKVVENPKFITSHSSRRYSGSISFDDIEEYAQFHADEYGWTVPDVRIYYNDGKVTAIYGSKGRGICGSF